MNIRACKGCVYFTKHYGNKDSTGKRILSNHWCIAKNSYIKNFPKQCNSVNGGKKRMNEYINININPADYVEVWEVEDQEHGKQLVMAVDDLKYLPPADVRPVVRGKWIPVNFGDMMCSNCGGVYGVCGGLLGDYYFCPNCSADMRQLEQN